MAKGRGGARVGAGRPKGGVSRSRLMLEEAANRGIAEAYYLDNPGQRGKVDIEEAMIRAAAGVITEMMRTGRGDEALKFTASVSTPESERSRESMLSEALARMPMQCSDKMLALELVDDDTPPPPTPTSTVIPIGKQRKF